MRHAQYDKNIQGSGFNITGHIVFYEGWKGQTWWLNISKKVYTNIQRGELEIKLYPKISYRIFPIAMECSTQLQS